MGISTVRRTSEAATSGRRSVDGLAQRVRSGQADEGSPLTLVDEEHGLEATVDLLGSVDGEP